SQHDLGLALGPSAVVGDVLIAFAVTEFMQGNADLNGDGDADDDVLFVYDARTGVATNTGLALATSGPFTPAIGLGLVDFGVSECAQGGADLDGDGHVSFTSVVLCVYDSRTGLSTNTTRPLTGRIVAHDEEFVFTTDEAVTGDLNGDGDASDADVFQMYDGALGGVVTVPVSIVREPFALGEDWFALLSEHSMDVDLNDDG